ncbi:MAG TPA: UDP-N-acetylmuramate dehydrogenase [Bacteroidales bacterium]|nr:UDP-N-acetylmuramate dehydrogenase [Bacteroidales bacterium]
MVFFNYPLRGHNTFRLDVKCKSFHSFEDETELAETISGKEFLRDDFLFIGSGSNILFTGDYHGTIFHLESTEIKIVDTLNNDVIVVCDAGVKWDDFVFWCVDKNLGGLENLSFIPGTVGASPVQNIGAYGGEVKDYIIKVKAVNTETGEFRFFTNRECEFSYRNSLFKSECKGKYIITKVWFRLKKDPSVFNLSYGDVDKRVKATGNVNLLNIRNAIIEIRKDKLPDPDQIGNAGSFFRNPVISSQKFRKLSGQYPDMPSFTEGNDRLKTSAAWMIEKCGWKGKRVGDAGVYEKQALVLVNHGNASGKEILDLSERIRGSVRGMFGIELEREVNII